jgi:hypothetical protein
MDRRSVHHPYRRHRDHARRRHGVGAHRRRGKSERRRSDGVRRNASAKVDPHHPPEAVQASRDLRCQTEVAYTYARDPDELCRATARRGRAGRAGTRPADEPSAEHDEVCRRTGSGGRGRSWFEPVLGGSLCGRDNRRGRDRRVTEPGHRAASRSEELGGRHRRAGADGGFGGSGGGRRGARGGRSRVPRLHRGAAPGDRARGGDGGR